MPDGTESYTRFFGTSVGRPVAHATGRDISPSGLHYRRTCVEQRVPRRRRGDRSSASQSPGTSSKRERQNEYLARVYIDRAVGGDLHHRSIGESVASGSAIGPRSGSTDSMFQQCETTGVGTTATCQSLSVLSRQRWFYTIEQDQGRE